MSTEQQLPAGLAAVEAVRRRGGELEPPKSVTPLELFFDLVFVFAITQVTGYLAENPTWEQLVRGLMVLAVLWFAWVAYSWLTNTVDVEADDLTRLAVLCVMAAMLVVSLSVPGAFNQDAAVFGVAYFLVRALHPVLYFLAARRQADADLAGAVKRIVPPVVIGPGLLIVASGFDGTAQGLIWAAAIAIDYGGVILSGIEGWSIHAGHFAERHGLIVIVALGESIVALGVGAAGLDVDAGLILAAIAGIAVAAAMWWAYFDVIAIVAEHRLAELEGSERARLARDSYSYLHLPMVTGIILFALGVKKTLEHVDDPLKAVPAVALCGGVALYLLAHIAFRLRNVHSLNRQRLAVAILCLALIPAALELPALASLGIIAGLTTALIAYEAIHFAEARARVRRAVR